jgi:hypothetical protein
MTIKRFAQKADSEIKEYWYELQTGERIKCNDATIDKLWCQWVASGNSRRADTEEFTIFEFIKPVEIDLHTTQSWIKCDFGEGCEVE